jgi:methylated-DNA-[protein]-cysteine S-methyltransferase
VDNGRVGIAVFDTVLGVTGLAWTESGVGAVAVAEADAATARARLQRRYPDAVDEPPPPEVAAVIERIAAHLAGRLDPLRDVALDLCDVGQFRRDVYELARSVEPGETITYGEIARRLGNPHAAREVGQAMGANPVPIIVPCHRVLAADNRMGGFSAPGGVSTKLRLLAIEGAVTPEGQAALF